MYQPREGSGAMFRNDRKSAANQPDMRGTVMIGGVEMEISAWEKTTKNGSKFLSVAVKPKGEYKSKPQQAGKSFPLTDAKEDDLPF
jgi:hypothetical protein